MNTSMNQNNEFQVDSPEAHQLDAVLNQSDSEPSVTDDIDDEAPAGSPVTTPVATAPMVVTSLAEAQAAVAAFDKRAPIKNLVEPEGSSVEDMALKTKEILSKEPKVRMMIPLDPGEKAGAYRTVSINGYRFDIRKNTMVDLPESVAALLADAYRITSDVVENNPLNLSKASGQTRSALGLE